MEDPDWPFPVGSESGVKNRSRFEPVPFAKRWTRSLDRSRSVAGRIREARQILSILRKADWSANFLAGVS